MLVTQHHRCTAAGKVVSTRPCWAETRSTAPPQVDQTRAVNPVLRRATAEDLPAVATVDGRAFGYPHTPEHLESFARRWEPERFLVACDDGEIVGVAGSWDMTLTLPGGAQLPSPGVTWVAVSPTHRRRGILRSLMTELHRGYVADGLAVSMLLASEGTIYGRFGYGPATVERAVTIDRRRAVVRSNVPDPGGVSYTDTDGARKHVVDLHRRWCAGQPGAVSRTEGWWEDLLRDPERYRNGASALFHLVHPDGYVSYRINHHDDTCRIMDFFAATDEAHLALWRLLLSLDLVETITVGDLALDDPLPFLLTDPRQVCTTAMPDGLWVRVLDVPVALSARRYPVEIDVVLEVHDPFLDRGGRFRLRGGPEGAVCEPSDAPADVDVEMRALGSLLLGGHRARTLARAGLVTGVGALTRLDAAFRAEREPRFATHF
jgi:predicted acetyltransferase